MRTHTLPVLPSNAECSGECCTGFTLNYSPDQIRSAAESDPEGALGRLGHMLVYLGEHSGPPRGCGVHRDPDYVEEKRTHWYTCVHYDRTHRRCLNYENRPALCSEYPYGGTCQYKGCTQRGNSGVTTGRSLSTGAPLLADFAGCPKCGRLGQKDRRYLPVGQPLIASCNKCDGRGE